MKKILFSFLLFILLCTNVYAAPTKKECQDAIVNSGYAYYYRGKAIQYDSKRMTFQNKVHAQNRNGGSYDNDISSAFFYHPEEATMQDFKYTVCSGFTELTIYEAFTNSKNEGFVIRDKDNNFLRITRQLITIGESEENKDIVAYYNDKLGDYKKNKQKDKMKEVYKALQDTLEPGDIIVRTTNGGGHAVLYVGNDIILESGGDSVNRESDDDDNYAKYDFNKKSDNVEPNGTVKLRYFKRYTDSTWKDFNYTENISGYNMPRNLIGGSVKKIIVIRVANRIVKSNEWRISDNAKNRSNYPKLSFTKTANRSKYSSIAIGDSIKYTISLTNNSNKNYKGVSVVDEVPANTKLEEMTTKYSGKNNNGKLSWSVDVPANKTVKITFKVRVNKDSSLYGSYITSNKTKVNNIKLNTIKTLLIRRLTDDTKSKLDKLKAGDSYNSTAAFLNYLFSGFNFPEPDKIISHLFKTKQITNKWKDTIAKGRNKVTTYLLKDSKSLSSEDKKYMNMYVDGLFGGFFTYKETNKKFNDDRSLTFTSSSFLKGDILLIVDYNYKDDTKTMGINSKINAYVYLGDSKFATVNNKKLVIIDKTKGDKLIESLLGQDCFIVLRPMKSSKQTSTVEVTGISLNKNNVSIKVGNSETLTATITPSNATNKSITWSSSNNNVATVNNGTIKGVSEGTAVITAKTNNGKTATCNVSVTKEHGTTPPPTDPTPPSDPEPTDPPPSEPDEPSLPEGESDIKTFIKENIMAIVLVGFILLTFVYVTFSKKH